MKPPRPVCHITLAGRRLSAQEAALLRLEVSLGRFAHDRVVLLLWPKSKFGGAQPGDPLAIEMGGEDDETDVWTGTVASVRGRPDVVIIEGLAPTADLSTERKAHAYVGQSADDVVRDLASSIDIDQVDTQLELDYYAVDQRRTVWGHLTDLALLAGADLTCSAKGGLRFMQVRSGPAARKYRYGADLLDWNLGPAPPLQAVSYAPHGAASDAGKEKWHWVRQEAAAQPGVSIGSFHSQASADILNSAAQDQASRSAIQGRVRLWGKGDVRTADVIEVDDLPAAGAGNPGPLRVLSVQHQFRPDAGFITALQVESAGGPA